MRPFNGEHDDGLGKMTSRVGDRLDSLIHDGSRAIKPTTTPALWYTRPLSHVFPRCREEHDVRQPRAVRMRHYKFIGREAGETWYVLRTIAFQGFVKRASSVRYRTRVLCADVTPYLRFCAVFAQQRDARQFYSRRFFGPTICK